MCLDKADARPAGIAGFWNTKGHHFLLHHPAMLTIHAPSINNRTPIYPAMLTIHALSVNNLLHNRISQIQSGSMQVLSAHSDDRWVGVEQVVGAPRAKCGIAQHLVHVPLHAPCHYRVGAVAQSCPIHKRDNGVGPCQGCTHAHAKYQPVKICLFGSRGCRG